MNDKVYVAIYTNKVKDYCDEKFFEALGNISYKEVEINIIDNTNDYGEYWKKLLKLGEKYLYNFKYNCNHIKISREPIISKFQRNVFGSVSLLQNDFLKKHFDYFLILESDVIVPSNVIEMLLEVKSDADIIGGLYYDGYHKQEWFDPKCNELVFPSDQTILSGCTMYSREVIENIPFRYDEENLKAFPDAFMSVDAGAKGYKLANYCKIKCRHIPGKSGKI